MLDLEKVSSAKKAPLRQLRVAELIRKVIAETLARKDIDDQFLNENFISVTKVKISPDLQNATVFISAFNSKDTKELTKQINNISHKFRTIVNHNIRLKYSPQIMFRYDDSGETANRINKLIASLDKE